MAELRGRDDVAWSQIEEAHRQWEHKSKSINPAVGIVVSLAVAAATGGAGAALIGLEAGTVGAAMANAAFTTIASQAATSLIVNGGDLGAVFRDLTSTDALRALAMSVATAGLMHEAVAQLGIDVNPETMKLGDRVAEAGVRAGVGTVVDAAIGGQDFGEALKGNLIGAAVRVIGAEVAGKIGKAYGEAKADGIDPLEYGLHKALHAALGCGMSAAQGAGCAAGAVGGVAGAVVAEVYLSEQKVLDLTAKVRAGELTPDAMRAQLREWKAVGADLSRVAAVIIPGIPGGAGATLKVTREGGELAVKVVPDANFPTLSIRDHYAHHKAMVDDLSEQLRSQGYRVSDREASFRSACSSGRCRPDIIAEGPDGKFRIIEVKTGDADLSVRQSEIFPQISSGDAIPTGRVARDFGLKAGIPLREQGYPNGIPIDMVRFPGAKR